MSVKRLSNERLQYDDGNGALANGYRLFFYAAGSSTKQNTYNSSAGTVANTNPIVLNALGEPAVEIWLTTGQTYKMGLAIPGSDDPPAAFVWTEDNISGVNDTTVSADEWVSSGLTPTFVSATSFTLAGDQTSNFHVGRRVKTTVTAGTSYGTITGSTFGAVTTLTIDTTGSNPIDAGLSSVSYGLLRADNFTQSIGMDTPSRQGSDIASAATVNLDAAGGDLVDVTGSVTITAITLARGRVRTVRFTGTPIITNGASLVLPGGVSITAAAGDYAVFRGYAAGVVRCVSYSRASGAPVGSAGAFQPLTAAVNANALTATLGAGALLSFNDGSIATLGSSITVTVPSGQAVGTANGVAGRLWVGALKNSGTPELFVRNNVSGTSVVPPSPSATISTTAIAAAPSAQINYSTTLRSTQPWCWVGYIDITEATAGTWATSPTTTQGFGAGVPLPGQVVQANRTDLLTGVTGSTTIPSDNTIPQITEGDQYITQAIVPTSASNVLSILSQVSLANDAAGTNSLTVALFQDATANALRAAEESRPQSNIGRVTLNHRMLAATVASTTFKVRAGSNVAGTTTINGVAGGQHFNGVFNSFLEATEVMA